MSLEDWMPTLVAKLAEISGLDGGVRYYADMPGALLEFPILVVTTVNGDETWGASLGAVGLHELQATLFVSTQFLPESHSIAVPFIKRVRDKLAANVTLGGLVDHVGPSPEGKFYSGPGRITYASQDGQDLEYAGIIFRLQVKDHDTLTVSA